MASRNEKDRTKQIQDRCQTILMQMLKDEDNKYCVDCDAKGPRWASWNLGIFLCIRCAGIHRNLGVHISRVKSVNLDTWTPEQVVSLQQMGNSRARAVYEANLPDSFRRPQTDSSLEGFVRAKYEQKKYIAREWVPPVAPTVNWDKEIDEEMERQKKKKKSSMAPLSTISVDKTKQKSEVIPQLLPKPKSSVSPKPGRVTPNSVASAAESKAPAKDSTDLLGLDNANTEQKQGGDDIFSSFFSAPPNQTEQSAQSSTETKKAATEQAADLKTQEENFFNQPMPTEKEKLKLTKDSILALYGQPAKNTMPQATFSNQFAPSNQFQQPTNSFNPSYSSSLQNGFPQQAQPTFQQGFSQFGTPNNQFTQQAVNFSQFSAPTSQQQYLGQQPFGQNGSFLQQNGAQNQTGMTVPQNSQLPQQLANMSLGQSPFGKQQPFGNDSGNVTSGSVWH